MAIKTITKGETAEKSTKVDDNVVTVVRTVKPDENSPIRYVVNWTFDFANVGPAEILELASRALVIDVQRAFRAASDADRNKLFDNKPWFVRVLIDAAKTRKSADPATRIRNAVKKLDDAAVADLIAELQAALK